MKGSLKAIMAVLGFALIICAVSAAGNSPGNGKAQFVNLIEKTPVPTGAYPWVTDGASGKLMYKASPKPMFVFNAQGMAPATEYALISYAEPWGSVSNVLGTAVSDDAGDVHIKGTWNVNNLVCNEYPTPTSEEYSGTGSKIWLVPTSDFTVSTGLFTAWNPTEYLFETKLVNTGCQVITPPA
jgi:hypothetical protein